jgi:lipoyl(octanoyl) transferase
MALDRVLTDTPPDKPILRFYSWNPWTLSLGFHQQIDAKLLQRARETGVPIVRRDTGGRAVYHAQELTYSFLVAVSDPLAAEGLLPLYHKINSALLRGFEELGVAGTQASDPVNLRQHYRSRESDICFSTSVQSEIVYGSRKLVGSAQRRFQHTALQHGSILLGPAHEGIVDLLFEPEDRPGALEVIKRKSICLSEITAETPLADRPALEKMCTALTSGFRAEFDIDFVQADPDDSVLTAVEKLASHFRVKS